MRHHLRLRRVHNKEQNMKAIIGACVSFLVLTASFGAHAQATGVKLNMDSGLYVGAGLGRSEAREFCLHIGGGACDQKDTSWTAFFGYQVNRHLAFELGYVDLGESFSLKFPLIRVQSRCKS